MAAAYCGNCLRNSSIDTPPVASSDASFWKSSLALLALPLATSCARAASTDEIRSFVRASDVFVFCSGVMMDSRPLSKPRAQDLRVLSVSAIRSKVDFRSFMLSPSTRDDSPATLPLDA
jgi:hypothetical protein